MINTVPGNTELAPGKCNSLIPLIKMLSFPTLLNRRVLLIATSSINSQNIFSNGLFQNIYLIYRMAEAVGWLPIFIVNEKPKTIEEIPTILHTCRIVSIDEMVKQPIPIGVYLEIGMSVNVELRNYLKQLGARICKLYLGNILNIDIETPIFYHPNTFIHHSVGGQDEIWTSPHYFQHSQYASALNLLDPSSTRIAPYIWEPSILLDNGRRYISWRPIEKQENPIILIMEPNISFQKSSLVPIMIAEAFYKKNPLWDGEVIVVNGEKLLQSTFFLPSIYQHLQLVKDNKISFIGRRDMKDIMATHPYLTAICHQINNDYNYMTLELMYTGFPLIHNSGSWSEFGYYYKENDIEEGAKNLEFVFENHKNCTELYKSHSRILAWRHSLYNPDNQAEWKELLDVKTK